ncbi:MAG TPA: membrane protein insertase YidC, partial [Nitrospirota bacterium]|nr:membrane protein insertase YidC [Nitrospirota bacterium]
METRRFIMALSLSLLVFLVYVKFFAPKPSVEAPVQEAVRQEAAKPSAEETARTPVRPEVVAATIEEAVHGKDIVVETDLVKAVINTAGGVITRWELKNYREADKTEVGLGALYKRFTGQAKKEETPKKELGNVQLVPFYEGISRKDLVSPLTLSPLDKALSKLS